MVMLSSIHFERTKGKRNRSKGGVNEAARLFQAHPTDTRDRSLPTGHNQKGHQCRRSFLFSIENLLKSSETQGNVPDN